MKSTPPLLFTFLVAAVFSVACGSGGGSGGPWVGAVPVATSTVAPTRVPGVTITTGPTALPTAVVTPVPGVRIATFVPFPTVVTTPVPGVRIGTSTPIPTPTFTPAPTPTPTPVPPIRHFLEVSRHRSVQIDAIEADRIMDDASDLLQTANRPGDVATNVEFTRLGQVTQFTFGNGVINGSADFRAVERLPGNVKVVNQIRWCGQTFVTGIVLGCASSNSTSLTVIRWIPNMEGSLWTHEFGHNRNLGHRSAPNAVMLDSSGPDQDSVNQAESNAFR